MNRIFIFLDQETNQVVRVVLNGEEHELEFSECQSAQVRYKLSFLNFFII